MGDRPQMMRIFSIRTWQLAAPYNSHDGSKILSFPLATPHMAHRPHISLLANASPLRPLRPGFPGSSLCSSRRSPSPWLNGCPGRLSSSGCPPAKPAWKNRTTPHGCELALEFHKFGSGTCLSGRRVARPEARWSTRWKLRWCSGTATGVSQRGSVPWEAPKSTSSRG